MIFRRRFRRCGNNISSRRRLPTDYTCVRPNLSDSRNCFRNGSTGHAPWCSPYRTSTSRCRSCSIHSSELRPSCGSNIIPRLSDAIDYRAFRPSREGNKGFHLQSSSHHGAWYSHCQTSTSQYQSYSNHSLRRRPSSGGNTILRCPASTDHAPLFRRNSGNTDCRPPEVSQSVLRCSDSNTSFRRSVPSRQGRREQDVPQKHFAGKYFFRKGFGHKSV